MQATVILKDKSELFYHGDPERPDVFPAFLKQPPAAQFERCNALVRDGLATLKVGHAGSFRDKVELNQLLRGAHSIQSKVEPRRGYRLVTFTFSKA